MATLTPSQTIGPFFIEGLQWAVDALDRPLPPGTVRVTGRVLDFEGKGASDALLEIWQPGAAVGPAAADRGGFQRVATAEDGRFDFHVPAPVKAQVMAHVTVLTRGLQRHVFTRVYLGTGGDATRATLPAEVPESRRSTLVAVRSTIAPNTYEWNIRLRGADETVFFDL